jgi:hypothetical protein
MKNLIPLSLIILLAVSCNRQHVHDPKGGWQMIQMQMVDNGKVTNYFSDRYIVNQTKIWDDTATTYRYGVGTWTLNGNIYEETIRYHFDKSYEGTKNKIWLEFRQDTMLHIFPVNDAGVPNNKHWVEKYVRLK